MAYNTQTISKYNLFQFCYSNPPFFRGPPTAGSDPGEINFFAPPPPTRAHRKGKRKGNKAEGVAGKVAACRKSCHQNKSLANYV